jgi:hypothetical protein
VIPTPAGWQKVVRGDQVRLQPPPERPLGEIRYRERFGPLRTARQVVAAKLASAPGFVPRAITPPQRLVTHEGEYAAFIAIDGAVAEQPARRYMGIVFGDNFTTLLDAISLSPPHFDELEVVARDLTQRTTLILGVRRRRFVYQPPPGWQALTNVFVTNWYPPDFPGNLASIIAFPANPLKQTPQQILDALVVEERAKGVEIDEVSGPEALSSRHALPGLAWRIVARPPRQGVMSRELVVLQDSRYLYPLRLDLIEARAGGNARAEFRQVVDSVEPIPDPEGDGRAAVRESVDFWIS